MDQVTVSRELLRQVLDLIQGMEQNYGSLWQVSATAEHLDELDGQLRTTLEQPAVEPVAELDLYVDEDGPCLTFTPRWYGHLPNGKHNLFTAPQAQQPVARVIWPSSAGLPSIEWLVDTSSVSAGMVLYAAPQPQQPAVEPVAWRTQSAYPPGGYVIFQQYPQKLADLGEQIEPLYTAPQAQQQPQLLTDEEVREVYLTNGFTVKEGQPDLKPYVFASARAIEQAALRKNGVVK